MLVGFCFHDNNVLKACLSNFVSKFVKLYIPSNFYFVIVPSNSIKKVRKDYLTGQLEIGCHANTTLEHNLLVPQKL